MKANRLKIILLTALFASICLLPLSALADRQSYDNCVNGCYNDWTIRDEAGTTASENNQLLQSCILGCKSLLTPEEEQTLQAEAERFSGKPIGITSVGSGGSSGQYTLNVPIGSVSTVPIGAGSNPFGDYFKMWYGFIIGTVGILATIMIIIGGFQWLSSRGNSGAIKEGQDRIFSAIIGLGIAFLAYTILNLVNPGLTNLDINTGLLKTITAPINVSNLSLSSVATGANLTPQQAQNLAEYIANHESSYVLSVYKDQEGNLTAGTGHLILPNETVEVVRGGQTMSIPGSQVQQGDTITQQQAETWFTNDLTTHTNATRQGIPNLDTLPEAAQIVATDLYFQYGTSARVDQYFPGFNQAMSSGDWARASQILNSNSYYTSNFPSRAQDNTHNLLSL